MTGNHGSSEMRRCDFTLIDRDRGEKCPACDAYENSADHKHDRIDASRLNSPGDNQERAENVKIEFPAKDIYIDSQVMRDSIDPRLTYPRRMGRSSILWLRQRKLPPRLLI